KPATDQVLTIGLEGSREGHWTIIKQPAHLAIRCDASRRYLRAGQDTTSPDMELLTTELLTTAEMAQADRLTIAGGIAGIELMENAGRAVADHVSSRHPPGTCIAVVAGPGNNGGDGLVAGRLLRERGYRVRMLLVGDIGRLRGDAREAAQRWSGPYEPATAHSLMPDQVVIDALFGAGLDRPVEGSPRA